MKSITTFLLLAISPLFAIDYRTFEADALQKAPALQSAKLESDAARLEGAMALRYDNPSLEVEASRFDTDNGNDDNGWRANISQPIRVFGLGKDIRLYADSLETVARKRFEKSRAGFRAMLRSRFAAYVEAVHAGELMKEEIDLAKRLETIAEERFKEGAGTRAKVMQASLQRIAAESRLVEQERRILERYYDLLSTAQTPGKPQIDAVFLYPMRSAAAAANGMNNAELELLKARVGQLEAEAKMNDRSVKTYRLFAEYEEEPEQSIARIGLGVDLPFFNRYEEEKRLAKVRARQKALEAESVERMQRTKLEALERRLHALMRHHEALKRQRRKQAELLALFTEGYKTAQTSLLDLIQAQNSLIETKRKLLQIRYLNDLYHIQIDYLQGTDQ